MTDSSTLIFYDISSPIEPPRSFAPNPAKTELALKFKCAPFTTTFVDLLDIADLRKGLKCPASRKFGDGSDYYTLPMLRDPSSGKVVGESVDIANYLEDMFPNSGGCLFPQNSTHTGLDFESPNQDAKIFAPLTANLEAKNEAYAKFNMNVDAVFSAHVVLVVPYIPFNPKSVKAMRDIFVKRANMTSWDDLCIQGEARDKLRAAFKVALTSLAQFFMVHEDGPYLEGKQANYADLIVGGWLIFLSSTTPEEEWKDFRTWHGGVFARLHDALQEKYYASK